MKVTADHIVSVSLLYANDDKICSFLTYYATKKEKQLFAKWKMSENWHLNKENITILIFPASKQLEYWYSLLFPSDKFKNTHQPNAVHSVICHHILNVYHRIYVAGKMLMMVCYHLLNRE